VLYLQRNCETAICLWVQPMKELVSGQTNPIVCIAILLALKLTDYTIVEKSARKNGFDYWLGKKDDILFQKKARLEISGIFNGSEKDINKRYNVKVKQTEQSDALKIPAYIALLNLVNLLLILERKYDSSRTT